MTLTVDMRPVALDDDQKMKFITNLLQEMRREVNHLLEAEGESREQRQKCSPRPGATDV